MANLGMIINCTILLQLLAGANGQSYPKTFEWMDRSKNESEILVKISGKMHGLYSSLSKMMNKNEFPDANVVKQVRQDCVKDVVLTLTRITSGNMDALRFLDADSKPESGILNGNIAWTGDYSECISLRLNINRISREIRGRYFSVRIGNSRKYPGIVGGICLPDTCDKHDAKNLLGLSIFDARDDSPRDVERIQASRDLITVHDNTAPPLSAGAVSTLVILAFLVVMVVLGTTVDGLTNARKMDVIDTSGEDTNKLEVDQEARTEEDENTPLLNQGDSNGFMLRIFKVFSVIENTKRLMNTSASNNPLACLNGLRVFSMGSIILGHTYFLNILFFRNIMYAKSVLPKRWTFQPVMNGTFAVDTFFFMSGLLVAFLALKEMKSKGRLNWLYYFVHRLWRLTPLYAFLLLLYATMTPFLVSGPLRWLFTDTPIFDYHNCYKDWWTNMFYINNVYRDKLEDTCMGWTWYLANDMQFYVVLAPPVILLLHKVKVIGIILPVLLMVVCVSVRGGLAAYYDLNQFGSEHGLQNIGPLYIKPYTRCSTYVVGLITGFLLMHTNCRIKMNKFCVTIGWLISTSGALAVVYGLYYYNHNPGTNASPFVSHLYVALARTTWSLCLAWLVMACASGYGGWVNKMLSWQIWAPLARLTYAAYLIHPMVIVLFAGNQASKLTFTDTLAVYLFLGNFLITYGLSYLVSMVIEAPMVQLEKVIFRRQNTR